MTRKSKREMERAVEDMNGEPADSLPLIVHEDAETGEWYADETGETPLDRETADPLMIISKPMPDTSGGPADDPA